MKEEKAKTTQKQKEKKGGKGKRDLQDEVNVTVVQLLSNSVYSNELFQEKMMGQRGTLRALAVICRSH